MRKSVELLAPAGDKESLIAAVNSGADAVYMGLPEFNARCKAENFTKDDFSEAVEYAISHGVKVYLTINTLISDAEMKRAISAAVFAARAGASAFIVQDIGLLKELQKRVKGVELHASTQMSVVDLHGADFLYEQGCDRVVLSRELSLKEIAEISSSFKGELEVFVHGALCYSYSGQCLMSSLIGNRSGNRGLCAQPCRLPYKSSFTRGNAHLLSLKDLNALESLKPLIDTGVKSLKIEGRMKGPTYTAGVVSIYRKYIDQILAGTYKSVDEADVRLLEQLFNRGGFTNGYLNNEHSENRVYNLKAKNKGTYLGRALDGKSAHGLALKIKLAQDLDMGDGIEVEGAEQSGGVVSMIMANNQHVRHATKGTTVLVEKVKGVVPAGAAVYKTSSRVLNDSIDQEAKKEIKLAVKGNLCAHIGKPMLLTLNLDGIQVSATGDKEVEKAQNSPMTEERIKQSLCKSGDYPYDLSQVELDVEQGIFVPVSKINELRRDACEKLYKKVLRAARSCQIVNEPLGSFDNKIKSTRKVDVLIYKDVDRHLRNLKGKKVDRVFLPLNCTEEQVREALDFEVGLWLPNCTRNQKLVAKKIASMKKLLGDRKLQLMLGIMGDLKFAEDPDIICTLNYGFNIYNSYTSDFFADFDRTASVELDREQIKHMLIDDRTYFLAYGRVIAMTSATCVKGGNGACKNDSNFAQCSTIQDDFIEDRMGKRYQVLNGIGGCGSIILSCDTVNRLSELPYYASIRIDLSDEPDSLVQRLLK